MAFAGIAQTARKKRVCAARRFLVLFVALTWAEAQAVERYKVILLPKQKPISDAVIQKIYDTKLKSFSGLPFPFGGIYERHLAKQSPQQMKSAIEADYKETAIAVQGDHPTHAVDPGSIVGSAQIRLHGLPTDPYNFKNMLNPAFEHTPGYAWITGVNVDPNAQAKGVGHLLMNKLAEVATANDVGFLILNTSDQWPGALPLYTRQGFRTLRTMGLSEQWPQPGVMMARNLILEKPRPNPMQKESTLKLLELGWGTEEGDLLKRALALFGDGRLDKFAALHLALKEEGVGGRVAMASNGEIRLILTNGVKTWPMPDFTLQVENGKKFILNKYNRVSANGGSIGKVEVMADDSTFPAWKIGPDTFIAATRGKKRHFVFVKRNDKTGGVSLAVLGHLENIRYDEKLDGFWGEWTHPKSPFDVTIMRTFIDRGVLIDMKEETLNELFDGAEHGVYGGYATLEALEKNATPIPIRAR